MGSVLPTVIIVLAEVIVLLLIALGVMLYLHFHKNKRHRHEVTALMGIARHAEKTPTPQDAPHDAPAPSAHPTAPTGEADKEFADRTDQSIAEIREAITRLDTRLGQFHHEDKLHNKDLEHQIAEESSQIQVVRKELHDIALAMQELKSQHATLDQDLHNLRVEIEQHALHELPARAAAPEKNAAVKKGTYKYVTPPASSPPPHDPTLIDDFTLPDAVLEELEEVAKSEPHDTLATVDAPPATKTASSAENKSVHEPAAADAPRPAAKASPAHGGKAGGNGAASTVDEPQYAFNASEIKDMFSVPLFIPGAVNAGINVEELDFGGRTRSSRTTPRTPATSSRITMRSGYSTSPQNRAGSSPAGISPCAAAKPTAPSAAKKPARGCSTK
jgi:hypothetical protein